MLERHFTELSVCFFLTQNMNYCFRYLLHWPIISWPIMEACMTDHQVICLDLERKQDDMYMHDELARRSFLCLWFTDFLYTFYVDWFSSLKLWLGFPHRFLSSIRKSFAICINFLDHVAHTGANTSCTSDSSSSNCCSDRTLVSAELWRYWTRCGYLWISVTNGYRFATLWNTVSQKKAVDALEQVKISRGFGSVWCAYALVSLNF